MKKTFTILLLFIFSNVYSLDNHQQIDSLENLLEKDKGYAWIHAAISLSKEIKYENPEYSNQLLNQAIEKANQLNYKFGEAKAYQLKGAFSYEDNKVITGINFYYNSFNIFSRHEFIVEAANSLYGLGQGLSRIHKPLESNDTLQYIVSNFSDSLSPSVKSNIYHLISGNHNSLGNIDQAIEFLNKSIELEIEHQLKKELTTSYNNLGIIYLEGGDYKNAIMNYDLSEKIAQEIQDTIMMSYALHNKALIYLDWGVYDEALDLFLQARNLSRLSGLDNEFASTLSSIALIYHETKDIKKAKYYYYRAIELAEKYQDEATKSIVQHNLGELLFEEDKYDSALILLNLSLQYELDHKNTLGIAQSKSMIATVYATQKQYVKAFDYFREAREVFEKFGNKQDLAGLDIEYAKAHQSLGNDSISEIYFLKGIKLAKLINARKTLLDAYESAALNYERIGKYKEALQYHKLFKALNDTLYNENNSRRIDYLSLKLENQEREKELSKLENEKKVLTLEGKTRRNRLGFIIILLFVILAFFVWLYFLNRRTKIRITDQYHILLDSEQKIKALLDANFDSTMLIDTQGSIIAANSNNLNGLLPEVDQLIGHPFFSLFNANNQIIIQKFTELVISSKTYKELQLHEDNNTILNIKISPIADINNNVTSLAFYLQDITQIENVKQDKKKMENQLVQTQKMETIGTLAGGIAHDFNNYLATIRGYVSMSLEDIDKENHVYGYLEKTMKAVNLSQQTIKKLLAFSRKNDLILDKISLKQIINDSIDILEGSKPRNIKLVGPEIKNDTYILADKNQITQVILNICTNAFYAIADTNGTVEMSIEKNIKLKEFENKTMLCLKISDNGIGMDENTRTRVFEPFFTTKEVGKGTGLGLSVVTGIIKQHQGKIEVESQFGKGTVFSVYLPYIT